MHFHSLQTWLGTHLPLRRSFSKVYPQVKQGHLGQPSPGQATTVIPYGQPHPHPFSCVVLGKSGEGTKLIYPFITLGLPGIIVPSLRGDLCRWASVSDLGSRTCGGASLVVMLLAWIPGTFLAGLPPGDCGRAGGQGQLYLSGQGQVHQAPTARGDMR